MKEIELKVERVALEDIQDFKLNAKEHTQKQIKALKESIKRHGFCDPIGLWTNSEGRPEIVEGHGRVIAMKQLGYKYVPAVFLDHLSDEGRKEYTLEHNQINLMTGFYIPTLQTALDELPGLDLELLDLKGFFDDNAVTEDATKPQTDFFEDRENRDSSKQEENEEYNEFVEKFEPKRTTDDCYTPDNIYNAVAYWVSKEYGVERENMVRPFYPGGDYERHTYKPNDVVVDNPPFSILAEIMKFYDENGIKFFLFAPLLTLFSSAIENVTYIPTDNSIIYENGARVKTGFVTNLDTCKIRTAPDLYQAIFAANKENTAGAELPSYEYPPQVMTATKLSAIGRTQAIRIERATKIRELEAQKSSGKSIFGAGFLVSEQDAAAVEAAKEAAAKAEAQKELKEKEKIIWELSAKERAIIDELGAYHEGR